MIGLELQYIHSSPGRGSFLSASALLPQAKCKGSNVRLDTAILHQSPFYSHLPISRPIRHTVIFSLEILEKNNDECILILVIYWKKTGLLYTKISNHNIIYLS
jgi:hypothetical protein